MKIYRKRFSEEPKQNNKLLSEDEIGRGLASIKDD